MLVPDILKCLKSYLKQNSKKPSSKVDKKCIKTEKLNAIPVRADAAPQDHEQLRELQGQ